MDEQRQELEQRLDELKTQNKEYGVVGIASCVIALGTFAASYYFLEPQEAKYAGEGALAVVAAINAPSIVRYLASYCSRKRKNRF